MKKRVLFYSSARSLDEFFQFQYYKVDIDALKELDCEVILSNKIYDAFKFWKYDFVFAYFFRYSLFVAIIARFFLKKVYFTGGIDALEQSISSRRDYLVQKYLFYGCYLFATKCIIVSSSDLSNVNKIMGNHSKKLSYSEHTIDIRGYDSKCEKDKIVSTLVWQGTYGNVWRKGVDIALYVFSLMKKHPYFCDYKFVIMGGFGDGTPRIKELCEKYKIIDSVTLTGFVSEHEKKRLLSKSKCYLQLSRYEGFGVAALEAICANDILIRSLKGGLNNHVYDGSLVFNIESNWDDETQILIDNIINYDSVILKELRGRIESYYTNNRRKEDFRKIIFDY